MTAYTFELGFDWNMPSRAAALGLAYPLQWCLVNNDANNGEGEVVSPMKLDGIEKGDTIAFSIFDITDSTSVSSEAEPVCLQVLFKSANKDEVRVTAATQSPFDAQQITTLQTAEGTGLPSVAYSVTGGWRVTEPPAEIKNSGRFELWMNLTLENPMEPRYYQVDPEMVIGGSG